MPHQLSMPSVLSRRVSVLVAEADPAVAALLAEALSPRAVSLTMARSLAEARDALAEAEPDLALIAARLPDGPAAPLLAALCSGEQPPVAFVVGTPEDIASVLSAVALPGLRCLTKPLAPGPLEAALETATTELIARHHSEEGWQLAKRLLDEIPHLSAVFAGDELIGLNRAFLRFLGVASLGEFKARRLVLDRYLAQPPAGGLAAWACRLPDDALDRDHRLRLVHPDRPETAPHIFQAAVSRLPGRNRCLLMLSDITELELERRELLDLANRDPLTRTLNRRKLTELLESETARCHRYATPMAVALLDIDHFKAINDTYGHEAGDSVLVALARRLEAGLRTVDRLARFGGEEFVVIAPGIDLAGAVDMAERLRRAVAEEPFAGVGTVTASFGLAVYRPGDRPEDLLKRADEALYRAKDGGRNRVERETPPQTQAR
jgi:diguanylate cyclase (GGDEF)-like protein